ncbi:MAG: hypothetical protein ACE5K4_00985 [Candidatus Hydrothermarchaeota archaeon]
MRAKLPFIVILSVFFIVLQKLRIIPIEDNLFIRLELILVAGLSLFLNLLLWNHVSYIENKFFMLRSDFSLTTDELAIIRNRLTGLKPMD